MIAAYYGQELLSTFEDSIGEIALSPTSGGMFTIHVEHNASKSSAGVTDADHVKETLIWDRKAEQGFPETKILKQRIRNIIEPERNLGHSDTPSTQTKHGQAKQEASLSAEHQASMPDSAHSSGVEQAGEVACEDCR